MGPISVLVAQLHPTLCDPMGCSPPGSSVHGILQARILEWVAMPSSRGSSQPRDRTHIACIDRYILHHCAAWEVANVCFYLINSELTVRPPEPITLIICTLVEKCHNHFS